MIETAIRTVGEQLREPGNRELLADLPAGEPVPRPPPGRTAFHVAARPAAGHSARARRA